MGFCRFRAVADVLVVAALRRRVFGRFGGFFFSFFFHSGWLRHNGWKVGRMGWLKIERRSWLGAFQRFEDPVQLGREPVVPFFGSGFVPFEQLDDWQYAVAGVLLG